MGWNSWDCYGPTVTESEVKANADYMATHLKASGWEYVVVAIRWYVGNDTAHGYNEKDPAWNIDQYPAWNIDQYGRFVPAPNRFPSAAGGRGCKPLAGYMHAKITYEVPAGYTRFTTEVDLDQAAAGQNTGGTMPFLVFTKSPLLPAPVHSVRVPVTLAELGLANGATVHDLWSGRQVGVFTQQFAPYIRRHGAGFYRISARKASK